MTRPAFRPHWKVLIAPAENAVWLLGERESFVLGGAPYVAIAPLIDGTRDEAEIVSALAGRIDEATTRAALARLRERGYVGEAPPNGFPRNEAAFWSVHGVDPVLAEERLARHGVRIRSLGAIEPARFFATLRSADVRRDDPEGLAVVLADDYLDPGLAEINAAAWREGRPYLLVKPIGAIPWIGPFFAPGETGCWACLAERLRANREIEATALATSGAPGPARVAVAQTDFSFGAASALAVAEIAFWIATGRSNLAGRIVAYDAGRAAVTEHHLTPDPRCPICGSGSTGGAAERANVDSVGVPLRARLSTASSPLHRLDGGYRACPPEVTHERLKHLVSPITGIVAELKPIAEDERGRYSVWMASHALPGTGRGLADLRVSLANKSAGKGRTSTQARTSALCEAIERISMGFTGHEPRRRARLTGLGKAAIHPNDCMLLSEAQYATREERNAVRGGDWIPERFDPERPCDWTEVAVIAPEGDDAASRFLPTALCYLGAPDPPPSLVADSNGNAAGNTLEEAILQGFFELVERDAVAIWWYNRRVPRCVDLEGEGDPYLLETAGVYAERGHDFRLLEITSDLGIPVYAAVSRRFDPDEAIFGFGAHPDPLLAMHRAATELNQLLFVSQRPSGRGRILADPAVREPWIEGAPAAGAPFVIPDAFRSTSGKELVRASAALVHGKGLEFLVLDQTRPGIGFPVVKVIVPGLRPINPRFAPGRLYAGPDRGESDLNPLPVPR